MSVSAVLEHAVGAIKAEFRNDAALASLVQVYFISSDSVLRIWSAAYLDVG